MVKYKIRRDGYQEELEPKKRRRGPIRFAKDILKATKKKKQQLEAEFKEAVEDQRVYYEDNTDHRQLEQQTLRNQIFIRKLFIGMLFGALVIFFYWLLKMIGG